MTNHIGILIANLGTPAAPTPAAVRTYLAEFLSDKRVIGLPSWLWQPILQGIILRIRPKRSAHAYQKIWTPSGSPLLTISQVLTTKLQQHCDAQQLPVKLILGMRYGQPSIINALQNFQQARINKLLIFPLYPQYAKASTESVFDAVTTGLKNLNYTAEINYINNYATHPAYIKALAQSITAFWHQHKPSAKLLFSFHGLPENSIAQGDPYYHLCLNTAKLVATELGLPAERWQAVFQSRFGLQKWLQPYCDKTLIKLAHTGCKSVDVICPGFAVDCLETLEEMAIQNKTTYLTAGGTQFNYIPALNAEQLHVDMLFKILQEHLA